MQRCLNDIVISIVSQYVCRYNLNLWRMDVKIIFLDLLEPRMTTDVVCTGDRANASRWCWRMSCYVQSVLNAVYYCGASTLDSHLENSGIQWCQRVCMISRPCTRDTAGQYCHKANNEVTKQSNLDSGHIFFRLVNLLVVVRIAFALVSHQRVSSVRRWPIVATRQNQDSMIW